MSNPFSGETLLAHLSDQAARERRPRGIGFVGSEEGRVMSVNDDGTFSFRIKRSGRILLAVPDSRFHPYYAANH